MPDEPQRVMVIAAHPDDFELCCAGTVAKWMRRGWQARLVLVSSGDKGTANTMTTASTTSAAVLSQRHTEQEAAGAVIGLGPHDIVYMGQTDGELAPTMELRCLLAEQIRLFRPHALFTHDPWRPYLLHPDHRAVGIGVTDAISAARDPLNFPEQLGGGLTSWRVTDVYYFATIWPDTFVDVSETFALKISALRKHAGQMAGMPGMEERLHDLATQHGKHIGVLYAEAFKLMTVTIYPDL